MAFEGDLSNLQLGDVLQTLAMSRQVGTFVIRGTEERRLAVGVKGVSLLHFRKSLGLRICRFLTGTGRITEADLESALKLQRRRRDHLLVDLLVDEGACSVDDARAAGRYVAAEEIYELFLWNEGRFEFLPGEPEAPGPLADIWFDVGSIAMEAARRIDEWPRVRGLAPDGEVFQKVAGPGHVLAEGEATPDMRRLYELVDGSRTVEQLHEDFHLGQFDTRHALAGLVEAGLVRPAGIEEIFAAAEAATRDREHLRAADLLRRACEHDPGNQDLRRAVAETYVRAGEKRLAAAELVRVGFLEIDAGSAVAAARTFESAIRLDANGPEAHEGRMRAHLELGEIDAAVEAAQTAAGLRMSANDAGGAAAVAEEGLRLRPGDPSLMLSLAGAYLGTGRRAEGLATLDDVASILDQSGDDERRLVDVYRKILQIDPARRDCQQRLDEIMASERGRRRRLVQRLAVTAGLSLLALAAVPLLGSGGASYDIVRARNLLAEGRVELAQEVLEELDPADLSEDEAFDYQGLLAELERARRPTPATSNRAEVAAALEALYQAASDRVEEERMLEAIREYEAARDLLDGPEARELARTEAAAHRLLATDWKREFHTCLAGLSQEFISLSSRVSGVRDRFSVEILTREDEQALAELVGLATEVREMRERQQWVRVSEAVGRLVQRTGAPEDGSDVRIAEALEALVAASDEVRQKGDQAQAVLRRMELADRYGEAERAGLELALEGRVEQALDAYRAFLDFCDEMEHFEPRELYGPICDHYLDKIDLDGKVRAQHERLRRVLDLEAHAERALSTGDVEEAFRVRLSLVRDNRQVSFRTRFRLPVRFETRPLGAAVAVDDGTPGGRPLGRTPLVADQPLGEPTVFELRLDGYSPVRVARDPAKDLEAVVRVELPKRAEWRSADGGTTEAAAVGAAGRVYVCGRSDGAVRALSAADGTELARFETASLGGIAATPALVAGRLHVATLDRTAYVLDAETLREAAPRYLLDGAARTALLPLGDGVVVTDEGGFARRVDREGRTLWRREIGRSGVDPVLLEGRIVVCNSQELLHLDPATGNVLVRQQLPEEPLWGAPLVHAGHVYLGSDSGAVTCFSPARPTPLWRVRIEGAVRGRPMVAADALIVGTLSGRLHALDLATGAEVREPASAGGPVRNGLLPLEDGFVVVTEGGRVQRHARDGDLVWSYDAGDEVRAGARLLDGRVTLVTRGGVAVSLRP